MKEHSDDTSYEQYTAGYYVVDSEDSMYESNFKDAAFDLKNVGDVSGLVPTDYGYHILRLEEIIPAGAIPWIPSRLSLPKSFGFQAGNHIYSDD